MVSVEPTAFRNSRLHPKLGEGKRRAREGALHGRTAHRQSLLAIWFNHSLLGIITSGLQYKQLLRLYLGKSLAVRRIQVSWELGNLDLLGIILS